MTLPEVILWERIRGDRLSGLQFRRQHPIGPYILDFFCAAARLALEVDGTLHASEVQARHDETRDAWLMTNGITVLRIAAGDILRDETLDHVLLYIAHAAAPSTAFGGPPPP